MPARQPFTLLCQAMARPRWVGRADLHSHTTCSDGDYTPEQLVDLARRSGLAALAITDHDTLAGIAPARRAAGQRVEIIAGVEISTEWRGRELHLLGYFVDEMNEPLERALRHLQEGRVARFHAMVRRLAQLGVALDEDAVAKLASSTTVGRRHVAQLLVQARRVATIGEAFQRWLADGAAACVPKVRLPIEEATTLVREAGGVAAWAHPPYDALKDDLRELQRIGMHAVEVDFPHCRSGRRRQLREWARELGLAVTGGSDCHGPDGPANVLGACGVTWDELTALRARAARPTLARSLGTFKEYPPDL